MTLTHLNLSNFRNHTNSSFQFGQKTLIIGPNSSGKTNILEAIRFLSVVKSFRTRKELECIQFGQEVARIIGVFSDHSAPTQYELAISSSQKQLKIDKIKRIPQKMIGSIPTVLFTPMTLAIIAEGPQERRRFMDGVLAQTDREYLWSLIQYNRVIRQRNSLLKEIANQRARVQSLEVWDNQLIQFGLPLRKKRDEFIEILNEQLTYKIRSFGDRQSVVTVKASFSSIMHDDLRQRYPLDIRFGATSLGPHHDDFTFLYDGRSLLQFGSRGQWRSVVVACKIIEGEILFNKSGKRAIYLLDDVFSEFDPVHRKLLLEVFGPSQVIFTTADTDHDWIGLPDFTIVDLAKHDSRTSTVIPERK